MHILFNDACSEVCSRGRVKDTVSFERGKEEELNIFQKDTRRAGDIFIKVPPSIKIEIKEVSGKVEITSNAKCFENGGPWDCVYEKCTEHSVLYMEGGKLFKVPMC